MDIIIVLYPKYTNSIWRNSQSPAQVVERSHVRYTHELPLRIFTQLLTLTVPTGLFIDNTFTTAEANKTVTIENPTTASPIGAVSAAQTSDVDRAVLSSRKASATWKTTPPQERRRLLNKLADLIERDVQDFASIEAVDAGMLYNMSMGMSVPQAAETCRYFAGWADKLDGQSIDYESGLAYTKREPIGVCAAVVPWNTPL